MNALNAFTVLLLACSTLVARGQHDTLVVHRDLQEALREPDRVRSLDLSDQRLGLFPMDVLKFRNLQELRLRNDGLSTLPPEIGQLRKLRLIDLSGNPIGVLPEQFAELQALEVLYLNEDRALDLERDLVLFAQLPNLHVLHLEGDGLSTLPGNISTLRALEELHLNGNRFSTFPDAVRGLEHLKLLDLRANPMNPLIPLDLQNRGVLIRF